MDLMIGFVMLSLAVFLPFEFERGFYILGSTVTPWEGLLLVFFLLSGTRWIMDSHGQRTHGSSPPGQARGEARDGDSMRETEPERSSDPHPKSPEHPSDPHPKSPERSSAPTSTEGSSPDFTERSWRTSAIFAAVYLAIVTAAALTSSAPFASVLKPVLRYATTIALMYLTWFELQRRPRLRTPVVLALSISVLVATLLGLAESSLGLDLERVFSFFRRQLTLNEGDLRLTGPFHHANEAAAAIALSLILLWTAFWAHPEYSGRSDSLPRRAVPVMLTVWTLAATLLATGLVLTLSRAGIVAGLGGWLVLGLLGRKRVLGWKRKFVLVASFLVPGLALALSLLGSSAVRDRIFGPPDDPYAIHYVVPEWTYAAAGKSVRIPIEITNAGSRTWKPGGPRPFHLAYHIADIEGEVIDFEGVRSKLPSSVPSGATTTVHALLQMPDVPGEYTVIWDLVHEEVTWFSQAGSPGAVTALSVTPFTADSDTMIQPRIPSIPASAREFAPWNEFDTVPRSTLWPIALHFWREHPWLGIGPDQFRHRFAEELPAGRYDPKLHANNLYLELGATSGTLGLVSYLLWLGTLVWILGRRALRPGNDSARTWSLGGLGLLGVFLAHGLFDTFLEPWAVQGLLALGLGATLCHPEPENATRRPKS